MFWSSGSLQFWSGNLETKKSEFGVLAFWSLAVSEIYSSGAEEFRSSEIQTFGDLGR